MSVAASDSEQDIHPTLSRMCTYKKKSCARYIFKHSHQREDILSPIHIRNLGPHSELVAYLIIDDIWEFEIEINNHVMKDFVFLFGWQ